MCSVEFATLAVERTTREARVVADVVEVQMTVDHGVDFVGGCADVLERTIECDAARAIVLFCLGVGFAEAGVEENR